MIDRQDAPLSAGQDLLVLASYDQHALLCRQDRRLGRHLGNEDSLSVGEREETPVAVPDEVAHNKLVQLLVRLP